MGNDAVRDKKVVAFIPARGGSKRILNKNLIPMPYGSSLSVARPLIEFSIRAAKAVSDISEVWVSTDCPDIKKVALAAGAMVIDRPNDFSGDTASTESAMLHFAKNVAFDFIVLVQCTSPLIEAQDISGGLRLVLDGSSDSVVSVYREKGFYWNKNGEPVNYSPLKRPRSQDQEPFFKENGAFYVTSKQKLVESGCRVSGKISLFEMPFTRSFEIDHWDEVRLISALMTAPAVHVK